MKPPVFTGQKWLGWATMWLVSFCSSALSVEGLENRGAIWEIVQAGFHLHTRQDGFLRLTSQPSSIRN